MLKNPQGEFVSQVLEVLPLYMKLELQHIWGREGKEQESFILALLYKMRIALMLPWSAAYSNFKYGERK